MVVSALGLDGLDDDGSHRNTVLLSLLHQVLRLPEREGERERDTISILVIRSPGKSAVRYLLEAAPLLRLVLSGKLLQGVAQPGEGGDGPVEGWDVQLVDGLRVSTRESTYGWKCRRQHTEHSEVASIHGNGFCKDLKCSQRIVFM